MPEEAEVYRLLEQFRAAVDASEAAEMARMGQAYTAIEARLSGSIRDLAEQIDGLVKDGRGPTRGQIYQLERFIRLHSQTVDELVRFNTVAEANIVSEQQYLAKLGVDQAAQLMQAEGARIPTGFDRLPKDAVLSMVGNTADGTPLFNLLETSIPATRDAMVDSLQNAVAFGWNPEKTAREIAKTTNMALERALTIARTEQMRVWRTSTLHTYADWGVREYRRMAAHDRRTCLACLVLDGKIYSTEQAFEDHVCGRCTLVPVIPGAEEKKRENGKEWLARQTAATQLAVMGKARYNAWKAGEAALDDMATWRFSTVWGGAWVPTPAEILIRRRIWGAIARAVGAPIRLVAEHPAEAAVGAGTLVGALWGARWVYTTYRTAWPLIRAGFETGGLRGALVEASLAPLGDINRLKLEIERLAEIGLDDPRWVEAAGLRMTLEAQLANARLQAAGGWEPLDQVMRRMREAGFYVVDNTGGVLPALTSEAAHYVEIMLARAKQAGWLPDVTDLEIRLEPVSMVRDVKGPWLEIQGTKAVLHVPAHAGVWGTPEDAARYLTGVSGYLSVSPEGLLAHELGKYIAWKSAGSVRYAEVMTDKKLMQQILDRGLAVSPIAALTPNEFAAEIVAKFLLQAEPPVSVPELRMLQSIGLTVPKELEREVIRAAPLAQRIGAGTEVQLDKLIRSIQSAYEKATVATYTQVMRSQMGRAADVATRRLRVQGGLPDYSATRTRLAQRGIRVIDETEGRYSELAASAAAQIERTIDRLVARGMLRSGEGLTIRFINDAYTMGGGGIFYSNGIITVAVHNPLWGTAEDVAELFAREGRAPRSLLRSLSTPEGLIASKVGKFLQEQNCGVPILERMAHNAHLREQIRRIAPSVFASTGPQEFVGDIYARILAGLPVSAAQRELYEQLGGWLPVVSEADERLMMGFTARKFLSVLKARENRRVSQLLSGRTESEVATDLALRLDRSESFMALYRRWFEEGKGGSLEAFIQEILHARSSGTLSEVQEAQLQIAAYREFGPLPTSYIRATRRSVIDAANADSMAVAGYQALLRAMYDSTQELLGREGISEVTMFRWWQFPDLRSAPRFIQEMLRGEAVAAQEALVETSPLSVWSLSPRIGTVEDFLRRAVGGFGAARVPAERIISTGATGFSEPIILGGTDRISMITWVARRAGLHDIGGFARSMVVPETPLADVWPFVQKALARDVSVPVAKSRWTPEQISRLMDGVAVRKGALPDTPEVRRFQEQAEKAVVEAHLRVQRRLLETGILDEPRDLVIDDSRVHSLLQHAAWYNSTTKSIHIQADSHWWIDYADDPSRLEYVIYHELAHDLRGGRGAKWVEGAQEMLQREPTTGYFLLSTESRVSPSEFLADVFAALMTKKTVPPHILGAYYRMGGVLPPLSEAQLRTIEEAFDKEAGFSTGPLERRIADRLMHDNPGLARDLSAVIRYSDMGERRRVIENMLLTRMLPTEYEALEDTDALIDVLESYLAPRILPRQWDPLEPFAQMLRDFNVEVNIAADIVPGGSTLLSQEISLDHMVQVMRVLHSHGDLPDHQITVYMVHGTEPIRLTPTGDIVLGVDYYWGGPATRLPRDTAKRLLGRELGRYHRAQTIQEYARWALEQADFRPGEANHWAYQNAIRDIDVSNDLAIFLRALKGSASDAINGAFRSYSTDPDALLDRIADIMGVTTRAEAEAIVQAFDSKIRSHTIRTNTWLYRGVGSASYTGRIMEEAFARGDIVGRTFYDAAPSHTTVLKSMVTNLRHSVILEIRAPRGTRGLWMEQFSGQLIYEEGEAEFLLPRNTGYRILRAWRDDTNNLHLEAEIVDHAEEGGSPGFAVPISGKQVARELQEAVPELLEEDPRIVLALEDPKLDAYLQSTIWGRADEDVVDPWGWLMGPMRRAFNELYGVDGPPKTGTRDEVIEHGEGLLLTRGISAQTEEELDEYLRSWVTGPKFPTTGASTTPVRGDMTVYTGEFAAREWAARFGGRGNAIGVLYMRLDPGAQIMGYDEWEDHCYAVASYIRELAQKARDEGRDAAVYDRLAMLYNDPETAAIMHGITALEKPRWNELVILDRTKVTVWFEGMEKGAST